MARMPVLHIVLDYIGRTDIGKLNMHKLFTVFTVQERLHGACCERATQPYSLGGEGTI